MVISFRCPHCSSELSFDDLSQKESPCPRCGKVIPLSITERMRSDGVVDQCVICGLERLYTQKDFNRTLGASIFVGAAIVSLILYGYNHVVAAFLVLGAAAAVDYLLYKALAEVTICYRCHTQYRGVKPNPENGEFELGLAEKYDPKDKRTGAENPAAEWQGR
jgi:uncharacterized protein (DUF983 family)